MRMEYPPFRKKAVVILRNLAQVQPRVHRFRYVPSTCVGSIGPLEVLGGRTYGMRLAGRTYGMRLAGREAFDSDAILEIK